MSSKLIQLAIEKLQAENQNGTWLITQSRWKDGFTTYVKTLVKKVEGSSGPLQVSFQCIGELS